MTKREELIDFLKEAFDAFESDSGIVYADFVDLYLAEHPPVEVTDESEWFRKSIAEEMTRKELEDRLVEQNEIINQLRNNVNSLLEADSHRIEKLEQNAVMDGDKIIVKEGTIFRVITKIK